MNKIILLLFNLLFLWSSAWAQLTLPDSLPSTVSILPIPEKSIDLLTEPRQPLKSSFYSEGMWIHDGWKKMGWSSRYSKEELSLFGLEKRIKSKGRTIVYDASVKELPSSSDIAVKGIRVEADQVTVRTKEKTIYIPIEYSGTKIQLSAAEKYLIADYVNKSMSYSGVSPARVRIQVQGSDFNISIYKSRYTQEDPILKGFNLRARTQRKEALKQLDILISNNQLEAAGKQLEDILQSYPQAREFFPIKEKLETIQFLSGANKSQRNARICHIAETVNDFTVYDGMSSSKTFPIDQKAVFVDQLVNSAGPEVQTIYLDVKGMGARKAEAFVQSVQSQVRTRRQNVDVQKMPELNKDLFFHGMVESPVANTKLQLADYSGTRDYTVRRKGKTWKVGVGVKVKEYINKKKSQKFIHSFFKVFGKTVKKKPSTLQENIGETKKALIKKYKDIDPSKDYNCLLNSQLGMEIVIIEELIEDSQELVVTNH